MMSPANDPLRFLPVAMILLVCSCSPAGSSRKPTFPVTGEVYVDEQPAAEVAVTLHNIEGFDQEQPTVSATFTDENGKFAVSTYDEGDGVPAGIYTVTFSWGKLNPFSMQYENDKFKKKYSNPDTSGFRITVEEGTPTDMGRINLSLP